MQTIGQAYEDMQTQNQNLLDQVIERDDYNIKVCLTFIFSKHCLVMIFTIFPYTTVMLRLFSGLLLIWLMKNICFNFVSILTFCKYFEELVMYELIWKN